MKDSFDDIIKKALEDHTIVPNDASWDVMKDKMEADQSLMSDESLDNLVKEQFSTYEIPYKSSHWNLLRNKLRLQARNLENLYVSKSFEFITFILLLMTFMQYGFDSQSTPNYKLNQNSFASEKLNVEENKSVADFALNQNANQSTANQTSVVASTLEQNIPSTNYNTLINQNDRLQSDYPMQVIWTSVAIPTEDIIAAEIAYELEAYEIAEINVDEIPSHLYMLTGKEKQQPEIGILTPVNKLVNKDEITKHLSVYASFDNNLINTPTDVVYKNIDEVLFDAPGISVGATYDLKLNQVMEVGAGLGYSRLAYQPQLIEERFLDVDRGGTYNLFLENIQYDMVQIPLHMKLNVLNGSNWSIFTQLGITGNLITHSNYETVAEVIYLPRDTPSAAQQLRDPYSNYSKGVNQPKLHNKRFTKGVFQGGNFKSNVHLTANVGLGFSRKLSDKVNLFSLFSLKNPALNFAIGPNQDRLGSLSISAGAQMRI